MLHLRQDIPESDGKTSADPRHFRGRIQETVRLYPRAKADLQQSIGKVAGKRPEGAAFQRAEADGRTPEITPKKNKSRRREPPFLLFIVFYLTVLVE